MTILDWIVGGVVLIQSLVLLTAPWSVTPRFEDMFREFVSNLALLTRLVMHPAYGLVCGLLLLGLGLTGAFWRGSRFQRRLLLAAAFFFGLATLAVYALGLYAPVFEMAGAVAAQ